jgi:hypothetical protein
MASIFIFKNFGLWLGSKIQKHINYYKMKTLPPKLNAIFLLLVLLACSKNEEAPKTTTFFFDVGNYDEPTVNGIYPPVAGASVKVYATQQSWLDGGTPIKTFTTDSKGKIESLDKFTDANLFFVESGNLNNWPDALSPILNTVPNFPGALQGSAFVRDSFLSLFEGVSGKSFLLTDVRQNNVSIFGSVSSCSKDNLIKLQKNLKLIYSEGASVCSGNVATLEIPLPISFVGKKQSTPVTINATSLYEFSATWPEASNKIYVTMDFTQVWTKENVNGNIVVSIYTKQP